MIQITRIQGAPANEVPFLGEQGKENFLEEKFFRLQRIDVKPEDSFKIPSLLGETSLAVLNAKLIPLLRLDRPLEQLCEEVALTVADLFPKATEFTLQWKRFVFQWVIGKVFKKFTKFKKVKKGSFGIAADFCKRAQVEDCALLFVAKKESFAGPAKKNFLAGKDFSGREGEDQIRSGICVSLREGEESIGVIEIDQRKGSFPAKKALFSSSDLLLGRFVADQVAGLISLALERKTLQAEIEQLKQRNEFFQKNPDILGLLRRIDPLKKRKIQKNKDQILWLEGEAGTGKSFLASVLHKIGSRHQGPFVTINCTKLSPSTMQRIVDYHYRQGNVAELKETMEAIFANWKQNGGEITPEILPERFQKKEKFSQSLQGFEKGRSLKEMNKDHERELIIVALNNNRWNKSQTAKTLGIGRTQLYKKLKEYEIRKKGKV